MVNLPLLQNQMEKAESYVYTIGQILMKLAEQSGQIATLIEQDLAVPELSLEACGKELLEYARRHQENGYWACAVFELDAENPALKVILDFYKSQALGFLKRTAQTQRNPCRCKRQTLKTP